MESEYIPFHDHSSFQGRLQLLYHRLHLRWILPLIVIGTVCTVLLVTNDSGPSDLALRATPVPRLLSDDSNAAKESTTKKINPYPNPFWPRPTPPPPPGIEPTLQSADSEASKSATPKKINPYPNPFWPRTTPTPEPDDSIMLQNADSRLIKDSTTKKINPYPNPFRPTPPTLQDANSKAIKESTTKKINPYPNPFRPTPVPTLANYYSKYIKESTTKKIPNLANEDSKAMKDSTTKKINPYPNPFRPTPVPTLANADSRVIKDSTTKKINPYPNPFRPTPPSVLAASNTVSPKYTDKPSFWNGTFKFEGDITAHTKAPSFGNVVVDKLDVLKVELNNVTINAMSLTKDLMGCNNLKAIVLSNVRIVGDFGRVNLPALELFIFYQNDFGGDETKATYQDAAKLKSRLFFDKTQNWDLETEVANLGVKIDFSVAGITILRISEVTEEIALNVPFCNTILKTVSWPLSTLSIIHCDIESSVIPTNLLYFNPYKVKVIDGNFTSIFKSFTRLTDLYIQITDEIINLSDFPPTLKTLTAIDTDLDYRNDYRSTIENFSIGYKLGAKVLECIDKIFSTVQRVAVFGIPDEVEQSILVQKLLLNTTAKWIVLEEFKRNPNSNFPIQQWVEQYLTGLGVPQDAENILLSLNRNAFNGFDVEGMKNGRGLMPWEVDYYHYVLLGWFKVTTFEAYQRIQNNKINNLKSAL